MNYLKNSFNRTIEWTVTKIKRTPNHYLIQTVDEMIVSKCKRYHINLPSPATNNKYQLIAGKLITSFNSLAEAKAKAEEIQAGKKY